MEKSSKSEAFRTIRLAGRGPNALSTNSLRSFRAELVSAGGAPLVITGEGNAFSAGLDLVELRKLDRAGIRDMLALMEETTELLHRYPGPTAAAINGHAIAGGLLVALTCDIRVATDNSQARFGMPALRMGIQYPPGVLGVLSARVPLLALETLLLSATTFGTTELLRRGLVDELAPSPVDRATELLAERASIPVVAYRETKRDLGGRRTTPSRGLNRFEEVLASWVASDLPLVGG